MPPAIEAKAPKLLVSPKVKQIMLKQIIVETDIESQSDSSLRSLHLPDQADIFDIEQNEGPDIEDYRVTTWSLEESLLVTQETQNTDKKY